ncbi:MAG TPA: hypothetical protein VMB91_13185 [Solirubrobacteraceae bacterium]|nr:hypothetical protein [Solirubrobacteraceae bacterium]
MPGLRGTIATSGLLAGAVLLLAACGGSTDYNTDLTALASAVEKASHGHVVQVKCAGTIPYERQKKFKESIHAKSTEYRYYCKGQIAGEAGAPKQVTKVIRVTSDGKHWHESTSEDRLANL